MITFEPPRGATNEALYIWAREVSEKLCLMQAELQNQNKGEAKTDGAGK